MGTHQPDSMCHIDDSKHPRISDKGQNNQPVAEHAGAHNEISDGSHHDSWEHTGPYLQYSPELIQTIVI